MIQTTPTRSWEWAPSPLSNTFVAIGLRIPGLHRFISKNILLLSFTGRKSKQHYTTPVGYLREGNTVTILTKVFRGWWHNFQAAAPVELLIERKWYRGCATAMADAAITLPILTEIIQKYPYYANFYSVRMIAPNQPNMEDVRSIAPKVVVIQITLDA